MTEDNQQIASKLSIKNSYDTTPKPKESIIIILKHSMFFKYILKGFQ